MSISVKELSNMIMKQAEEKGFGTSPADFNTGEKIALIHSEVSEAYEAFRKKKFEGRDCFAEELGDVVQRVFHLAGAYGIDLEKEVIAKLDVNQSRYWKSSDLNEKLLK